MIILLNPNKVKIKECVKLLFNNETCLNENLCVLNASCKLFILYDTYDEVENTRSVVVNEFLKYAIHTVDQNFMFNLINTINSNIRVKNHKNTFKIKRYDEAYFYRQILKLEYDETDIITLMEFDDG